MRQLVTGQSRRDEEDELPATTTRISYGIGKATIEGQPMVPSRSQFNPIKSNRSIRRFISDSWTNDFMGVNRTILFGGFRFDRPARTDFWNHGCKIVSHQHGPQVLIWRLLLGALPTSHINLQPSDLARLVTSGVPNPRRYILYIGVVCGDSLLNQINEGGGHEDNVKTSGLNHHATIQMPPLRATCSQYH
ncbi:hypothetical protein PIB30_025902 [Stylosanthes scabra]|uniref:Uncharacterized protein n=1 Tax=Stylosanthes scabra TaxID=79078 RepID=A0ABU6Y7F5_9FABA|nr:hypothetical protein [Stylosanthes scabra]